MHREIERNEPPKEVIQERPDRSDSGASRRDPERVGVSQGREKSNLQVAAVMSRTMGRHLQGTEKYSL